MSDKSQKDFSEWIDVSPARINNYLSGRRNLPAADLLYVLALKGVNINWLLTGKGPLFIDYPENAIYTPQEQVFLHDLETEEGGITNKDEAIKSFRQLKEYQKHTNANKTEYVIGLKILKTTYGKRHQNIKTDTSL